MTETYTQTAQQALDLLQENFATYSHPYSMRGVLSVIKEVHVTPEALGSFVEPLTTPNALTCWVQLDGQPEFQEAIASVLPEESDNSYFDNLFNHVTAGEPLDAAHAWMRKPLTIPSWESYHKTQLQEIREAEATTQEETLTIGPHGNHRQREHDILIAAVWMVCRQKSSRNWPMTTNPERLDDALHLLSCAELSHTYSRGALTIASALARSGDEQQWRRVYDAGMQHLGSSADGDNFRSLIQSSQLDFAMQRGDYGSAVATEHEAFPLRHDSLTMQSLVALCTIIRENKE